MFFWLTELSDKVSFLNVFRYITFRTGGSIVTALIFVFLFGGPIIATLRVKQGKGQPIRSDGPGCHPSRLASLAPQDDGSWALGSAKNAHALTLRRPFERGLSWKLAFQRLDDRTHFRAQRALHHHRVAVANGVEHGRFQSRRGLGIAAPTA